MLTVVAPEDAGAAEAKGDGAQEDDDPSLAAVAKEKAKEKVEEGRDAAKGKLEETAAAMEERIAARVKSDALEQPDKAARLFFVYSHVANCYWSLVEYFLLVPWPQGAPLKCRLVYIVVAPLYKPLAPSMWVSLMSIAHFAFWCVLRTAPSRADASRKDCLAYLTARTCSN